MSLSSLPFLEIWAVDFEYEAVPGEHPAPLCMCALELHSGRQLRLWRPELLASKQAPFDTGPNSALLTYAATAELSCFLKLGWEVFTSAGAPDASPRFICSAGLRWAPGLVLKGGCASCPQGLPAPA